MRDLDLHVEDDNTISEKLNEISKHMALKTYRTLHHNQFKTPLVRFLLASWKKMQVPELFNI